MDNPKQQLELLAEYQQKFESRLQARTGLTVKVSLCVHSVDNSTADLLNLFEASLALPTFRQVSTFDRTWITHTDYNRRVSVFMPKAFDEYPEPEDDEGYAQAIENADAQHTGYPLKYDNDYNPY